MTYHKAMTGSVPLCPLMVSCLNPLSKSFIDIFDMSYTPEKYTSEIVQFSLLGEYLKFKRINKIIRG